MVHSVSNHRSPLPLDCKRKTRRQAHLWIELVDPGDGLLDLAPPDGPANVDSSFDRVNVDRRRDARLASEAGGRVAVALDDEVVHDEPVQIAVGQLVSSSGL